MADTGTEYVELGAKKPKVIKGAKLLDDENGADASNHTGLHASTRVCTDRPCLVIFIGYLVGMHYIFQFAQANGDWRKLTHGFDWKDDLCGVSETVKDAPYLFWCQPATGLQWQMSDGICVKECPTGADSTSMCPGPATVVNTRTPAGVDEHGVAVDVVVKGITRNLTERADYATQTWLMYCVPEKTTALAAGFAQAAEGESAQQQIMQGIDFAQENHEVFLYVAIAGVVLGYALLILVKLLLRPLVYVLLVLVELGSLAVALYVAYVPFCSEGGTCPDGLVIYPSEDFYRENHTACIVGGVLVFLLWILATALLCCTFRAIDDVIVALSEASMLVGQMPTLLLQPLLQILIKLPSLIFMLYGLAWIVSLGEPTPQKLEAAATGASLSGVGRSFKFKTNTQYMLVLWIYGAVWILETLTALGQYCISHAVVVHQVNHAHTWLPLMHGYKNGIVFHLGTLAFGGFVLGTLRLINAILSICLKLLSKGKDKDGKDKQSCVVEVLCCCCLCCMTCIMKMVELLNDLVYTDCALDGSDYITAVRDVIKIVGTPEHTMAYGIMETATSLMKMLGMASITGVGTYGVYTYLVQNFNPDPPKTSVIVMCVGCALILLFISLSFMSAFCQAAMTVMYVDMWEKVGGKKGVEKTKDAGEEKAEQVGEVLS